MGVLVTQSCLTLCDPMDCSLPGSSVHGILQARIQEQVVIFFPRGSFRDRIFIGRTGAEAEAEAEAEAPTLWP